MEQTGRGGGFIIQKECTLAYTFTSPRDMAQLYVIRGSAGARKVTDLNTEIFAGKQIGEVESFTFTSNDNKFEVEAFLTKPIGMTATSKHPLIVWVHGGPRLTEWSRLQLQESGLRRAWLGDAQCEFSSV